ncbi:MULTISPECIES: flagella synthesis protein FlgN [unclassified Duganella]|uniref:flagella synthesis protein FlgN n=1 Tax=unclassified Duganella TaxID=2636909 RepID=UPI000880C3B1|nr:MULTISPECIES: flagellar protein FlgN [unclassified Duganella]SDG02144.1 flagella synthesis protein FlgN [Duganella sp. OV458]SDJ03115.1 flagella synthesis protein FlgN [Duganella sp. OV510]
MTTVTPLNSLREEEQIMSTLLDLLRQEQQLLVTAEIEGLPAITTRKTALVTQMTLLSAQRHRSLGKCGYPAEEAGMDAWIGASGEARDESASLWQALLQHTREAKELNRINGMLINKQMGHTQDALQTLRPHNASANNFYGPSGISTSVPRSRGFLAG